uniref:Uncharacterized protein n=1 Tax=Octactis speculum TaxID=3111310 RepID=A0A7S2G550_9STRA|mmetsp:Transcript_38360/g.51976  ORF Transcript_38360/g.51976 Transcript_38360/m.51976 type:complete len:126 (+) Transcript_38360:499-876(+)
MFDERFKVMVQKGARLHHFKNTLAQLINSTAERISYLGVRRIGSNDHATAFNEGSCMATTHPLSTDQFPIRLLFSDRPDLVFLPSQYEVVLKPKAKRRNAICMRTPIQNLQRLMELDAMVEDGSD